MLYLRDHREHSKEALQTYGLQRGDIAGNNLHRSTRTGIAGSQKEECNMLVNSLEYFMRFKILYPIKNKGQASDTL